MFAASYLDGTPLVKQPFIREAGKRREPEVDKTLQKNLMKAITKKEFVSLALIAVTAPVPALGLALAICTVAAGNEFLLLALTLCGAVVSGINGFGRRKIGRASCRERV